MPAGSPECDVFRQQTGLAKQALMPEATPTRAPRQLNRIPVDSESVDARVRTVVVVVDDFEPDDGDGPLLGHGFHVTKGLDGIVRIH